MTTRPLLRLRFVAALLILVLALGATSVAFAAGLGVDADFLTIFRQTGVNP